MRKTRLIIKYVLAFALTVNGPFVGLALANEGDSDKPEKFMAEITPNSKKDLNDSKPGNVNEDHVNAFWAYMTAQEAKDAQIIRGYSPRASTFWKGQMWGHTIKGFPVEALIFYAAIGATMVRKAYTNSFKDGKQDPRWMENFITELTTPMGIISFFAFVLASGATGHLYSRFLTQPFASKVAGALSVARLKHAMDISNPSARKQYERTRFKWRVPVRFVGPLSMSMGMMASNIVHELDYVASYSQHAQGCSDALPRLLTGAKTNRASEDDNLACDLFYDELTGNALSWLPGLASMIVASTLSHALVNGTVGFVRGVAFKHGVSLTKLANTATWLVPIPGARLVKVAGMTGQYSLRFLNLYAFMEMDQVVTHDFFKYIWMDGQKSERLADGISDLAQHLNVSYDTPYRICENGEEDCEYHKSIHAIHKTASRFNQWRQHQMMLASMAHSNWFTHVSTALGSFDLAKNVYRQFFAAKYSLATSGFHNVSYFSGADYEKQIKPLSKEMLTIIDKNAEFESERVSFKPLNVVSDSPSRFLKSQEYMQYINNKDKLFVLRALFSAVDENVSLEPFFDDFEQANRAARREALNSPQNPVRALVSDLNILENGIVSLSEVEKQLTELIGRQEKLTPSDEEFNRLENAVYLTEELKKNTLKKIEEVIQNQLSAGYQEAFMKDHFINTDFRLPDTSLFFTKYGVEKPKSDEDFISFYFNSWDVIFQSFLNQYDNAEDKQAVLDDFKTYIKDVKEEFSNKRPGLVDHNKLVKQVDLILRKKVLSAGLEYLNRIITQKKQATLSNQSFRDHSSAVKERADYTALPLPVLSAFHLLGPDNIFAQLYNRTFICPQEWDDTVSNDCESTDKYQIQSVPKGMSTVTAFNQKQKSSQQQYDHDYYPSKLRSLRTPGAMDFAVASAVCGPDLNTDIHLATKEKAELIGTGKSSLEEEFKVRRGFFGRLFNEGDFVDLDMDDIIKQTPVFDRYMSGMDFKFYPPRITNNLTEKERQDICSNRHRLPALRGGLHAPVKGIYDSRFLAGDREYSNLLHLVLDQVSLNGVSSVEEFDKWWADNVEPYKDLYTTVAEREYKKLVERWFMEPLFRNDTKEVTIKSQNSQEDFLHLPLGAFDNMRFEVFYWSGQILHLVDNRKKYIEDDHKQFITNPTAYCNKYYETHIKPSLQKREDINIEDTKVEDFCSADDYPNRAYYEKTKALDTIDNFLIKFIEFAAMFDIGEQCRGNADQYWLDDLIAFLPFTKSNPDSDFDIDNENNIQNCQKWTKDFIEVKTDKLREILNTIGEALGLVGVEDLINNFNPQKNPDYFRAFTINTVQPDSPVTLLPDQLINYVFFRLNRIMEDGIHHANMVNQIIEEQ